MAPPSENSDVPTKSPSLWVRSLNLIPTNSPALLLRLGLLGKRIGAFAKLVLFGDRGNSRRGPEIRRDRRENGAKGVRRDGER